MMRKSLVAIILLGVVLFSCKKEQDTLPPVISFIAPGVNTIINIPDTLDVKVQVNDDRIIHFVVISIVNEDKIPLTEAKSFAPFLAEFTAVHSFVIDSKTIASGVYSIQVLAFDGFNTKTGFLDIEINEIPRSLEGFMAVTAPLSFQSEIFRLGQDFSIDSQMSFPQGCQFTAVHPVWERFLFAGGDPSVLTAINPFTFVTEWELPATPPRPQFTAIEAGKDILFATANGDAGIVDIDGNVTLRTFPYNNMKILCLAADENYMYAAQQSTGGTNNELTLFYRETGAVKSRKLVAERISGIVALDDQALVFFSPGNRTEIFHYNPESFILNKLNEIEGEILVSAEKVSDDQIIICTDAAIRLFRPGINRLDMLLEQPYRFCRYDALGNRLFLAKDYEMEVRNFTTLDLTEEISFNDMIVDFRILYNK
ncbi:MAG TPA: hypothetical protein PLW31_02010 [Bacteroidales bacterium]|nr:hypothetical protein [Bacteroidales bacterium]HOX76788.1 hypothetical protein [Bacteroidales bacterium]HPM91830.1 hypothetical protein [Bacteroidales bacterium]